MIWYIIWVFLFGVCRADVSDKAGEEYRLPSNYNPSHYSVTLNLAADVFETNRFSGTMYLTFTTQSATSEVKIHVNPSLTLSSVKLAELGGNAIEIVTSSFNPNSATEILTISLTESLRANQYYLLSIVYTGILRTDDLSGLYKGEYTDNRGEKHYYAATNLEPTFARRFFPCFDEPSLKSVFDIRVTHPNKYSARSNTPVSSSTTTANNMILTVFQATPKMSTYSVALVISEISCEYGENINSVFDFQVCSRDQVADSRALAIAKGAGFIKVLEDYTRIPYSVLNVGKLDFVAFPSHFTDATANWGLITFRESFLLWDSEESSNFYNQQVQFEVINQLAHMWFGNWITPQWWSEIYITKGLATYLQYFILSEVEPSWEIEKQFVVDVIQPGLLADEMSNSKSLTFDVFSSGEVLNKLNSISVLKGAAIFKMIQPIIDATSLRIAYNILLTENKESTITSETLWNTLNRYIDDTLPSSTSLSIVLDSWINKPGFPLIHVTATGKNITIQQKPAITSNDSDEPFSWYVPISYTMSTDFDNFDDTSIVWLLPSEDLVLQDVLDSTNSWIIVNNKQTGFYRVNYDNILWERIMIALTKPAFEGIHELNRAQIIDDFYFLTRNNIKSYSQLFKLLQFLKKDTAYAVWTTAFRIFDDLLLRSRNERIVFYITNYILDLIDPVLNSVPFYESKEESQIYTLARNQAQKWACTLGIQYCTENAVAAFLQYRDHNKKPDKNLRSVVYCNGLRYSTNIITDWNFLWGQHSATDVASEQVTILEALGCVKNATILNDYLKKSVDISSGIRSQDAHLVFSAVCSGNPEGVDVALDFLIYNFDAIFKNYKSFGAINNIIIGLANRFTTQEQLKKLNDFLSRTTNLPEEIKLSAETAIPVATNNLKITENYEKQLMLMLTPVEDDHSGVAAKSILTGCVLITICIIYVL